ncbi:uncharacterized protein C8A04DRAFT_39109 [Dichotomopilus funicola]|uniref:Uncharacterized protein n=1 Tax=Dichotomopilus funicola TaxID=1934379 RepID=A0AAN6UYD5_9PEZI|nr:hypothetical protein C8A04DRAFT_39109 [Dichotomopilus funicola]
MHLLTFTTTATLLALANTTTAWSVCLHSHSDFAGSTYTTSGPGARLPRDPDGAPSNPTTRCKLELWESTSCDGNSGPFFSGDTKFVLGSDWRNRPASFSTDCWAV